MKSANQTGSRDSHVTSRMERLAQFVSDSFDAKSLSQLENPPPHHLAMTSSLSSSSSSSAAEAAAGTLSPAENIDVEAVDEDGTRPAVHLSHGIRHIILQHQPQSIKSAAVAIATSHRRLQQSDLVVSHSVLFLSISLYTDSKVLILSNI